LAGTVDANVETFVSCDRNGVAAVVVVVLDVALDVAGAEAAVELLLLELPQPASASAAAARATNTGLGKGAFLLSDGLQFVLDPTPGRHDRSGGLRSAAVIARREHLFRLDADRGRFLPRPSKFVARWMGRIATAGAS
jgi:hypothetical protein